MRNKLIPKGQVGLLLKLIEKIPKTDKETIGKLFSIPTGILLYNINQNKINNEKNN